MPVDHKEAALVRLSRTLTMTPWLLGRTHVRACLDSGLGARAVLIAVHLSAFFNYLTRMADATGIEVDYDSPLPKLAPDRARRPATRPNARDWPTATSRELAVDQLPDASKAWTAWRTYRLRGSASLPEAERIMVAHVSAVECCDAADLRVRTMPHDRRSVLLQNFARKLSRAPWQMDSWDVELLRADGLQDVDLLSVISVVAGQNADSRLRFGLAAARAASQNEA